MKSRRVNLRRRKRLANPDAIGGKKSIDQGDSHHRRHAHHPAEHFKAQPAGHLQKALAGSVSPEPVTAAAPLGQREHQFAGLLWRHGQLDRSDIHQITGVHPTLTGQAVAALIDAGLVRNDPPSSPGLRGRPRIPIVIDPDRRSFVGLSLSPGEVRLSRLNPLGRPKSPEIIQPVSSDRSNRDEYIRVAASILKQAIDPSLYSIGVTVTGVVDPDQKAMLFSSAAPSSSPLSLKPIYEAAGSIPLILDNDLHALSIRWLMANPTDQGEVLLVGLDDGKLGASFLLDGRPQRGSVMAANEIGHMRLAVATEQCYCGYEGCLERIISSQQLHRMGVSPQRRLDDVLADASADAPALQDVLHLLTIGLANAVNFIRPGRLVIASPLARHPIFVNYLNHHVPEHILPGLRSRVELTFWQHPYVQSAENAAWLAIAAVFAHPAEPISR
ncbi:MAG: ROK family protein [Phycisphaerales bacterium]|nr:ROK family protein [Phycisphaerales bacterium]